MREGDAIKVVNEILGYKVPAFVPRFRKSHDPPVSTSPPISIPFKSTNPLSNNPKRMEKKPMPVREDDDAQPVRYRKLSDDELENDLHCGGDDVFEFEMELKCNDESNGSPIISEKTNVWERYGMAPVDCSPLRPLKNALEMKACSTLIERAFRDGKSGDNISVILINFGN
jgi:hypothetical protein